MKRILLLFSLVGALAANAQLTAPQAFTTAPADVFPLLDTNTRLDMVDYYNSGLKTASNNRMNGQSVITELTPASVSVKISDSSSAQVAVLPAGNDTVIAVVSTVATPGLDSTLKFYDSKWQLLPADKYFTAPTWSDWMTPGHDSSEVTAYTPFMLSSYFINPAEGTLTVSNNLPTFIDSDIYADIADALYPTLTYRWNGKKFVKQ
ncbi:MAG: DUF3256 family protein [Duncaniella sp.]|nr:DUF3256 family protein [Duncaniella sp.]